MVECVYPTGYTFRMYTILRSTEFDAWLTALKDTTGKARILHRIRSAQAGNFGDTKPVGKGVHEMRLHVGPGYRLYYTRKGDVIFWLLLGGTKSTQQRDIEKAISMALAMKD